jgi:hypothetical protein
MSDSVWLTPHVAVWSFSVHDDVAAGTHGLRANHLGQFVVLENSREDIAHRCAHFVREQYDVHILLQTIVCLDGERHQRFGTPLGRQLIATGRILRQAIKYPACEFALSIVAIAGIGIRFGFEFDPTSGC